MITGFLALSILMMRLFPRTPAARWLHLNMVELPLAALGKLQRKHILFLIVALPVAQPLMMLGASDIALVVALDMTLYVDAAIAVYAAAALARSRSAWLHLRSRTASWLRRPFKGARPRTPSASSRRPERTGKASNDDDGPGLAVRLAA